MSPIFGNNIFGDMWSDFPVVTCFQVNNLNSSTWNP